MAFFKECKKIIFQFLLSLAYSQHFDVFEHIETLCNMFRRRKDFVVSTALATRNKVLAWLSDLKAEIVLNSLCNPKLRDVVEK